MALIFLTGHLIDLAVSYSFKSSLLANYMDPDKCNLMGAEEKKKASWRFVITMLARLFLTLWVFFHYIFDTRSCEPILHMLIVQDVVMSVLKQPWIFFQAM